MIRNDKLPAKLPIHSATWDLWGDVWCLVSVKFGKGLNLLGPDWRPLWRNTTPIDVAGLLAEAELVLDVEKVPLPEQNKRKLDLAPQRVELVNRFMYHFPGRQRLEVLARDIDRERLFYECALRKMHAPDLEDERKKRRRIRDAAMTLERELSMGSDVDEHQTLLKELSRLRSYKPKRFEVPWHRFARKICLEYMVALLPFDLPDWLEAKYSRAHDALQVRFVQQALNHIGVNTVTRSGIYKAAYIPDGTEAPLAAQPKAAQPKKDAPPEVAARVD